MSKQEQGVPASRSGCQPTASAASASSQSGIPDAVIELVAANDPDKTPLLYACPKCGSIHSPRIYACADGRAHQAAREAAEDCYTCKTHGECDTCGKQTSKGWTRCIDCRLAAKLEKAVEVEDDGGPYCRFDGDDYYFDIEDARDAGCEWVSPCASHYPRIDAYDILENAIADMFEDASVDDLDGVEAFVAAVEAFNKAQRTPTFYGDSKRKINVAQAIEARRAETGEDTGSVHESAVPEGNAPGDSQ